MLYFAAIVSLSLIAKAFGNYAVTFLPNDASYLWHYFFAIGVMVLFVGINLEGPKDVAIWERVTVAIKFSVLSALSIAGIVYIDPTLLSPNNYPPGSDIFLVLLLLFLPMKGFGLSLIRQKICQIPQKPYPEQ